MERIPLDVYDEYPKDMRNYLRNYGWNFNKKACDFAISLMKRKNNGVMEHVEPMHKDEVDELLKRNGIVLECKKGYNHVYVANLEKAVRYGSSIEDELHLARAVKDVIDDPSNRGGNVFRKWYCDMIAHDEPVFWDEIL